jgi:hypothetical protein
MSGIVAGSAGPRTVLTSAMMKTTTYSAVSVRTSAAYSSGIISAKPARVPSLPIIIRFFGKRST